MMKEVHANYACSCTFLSLLLGLFFYYFFDILWYEFLELPPPQQMKLEWKGFLSLRLSGSVYQLVTSFPKKSEYQYPLCLSVMYSRISPFLLKSFTGREKTILHLTSLPVMVSFFLMTMHGSLPLHMLQQKALPLQNHTPPK